MGINTSSRGAAGAVSNFGSLLVENPSYRWAFFGLVTSAILVPLIIVFWDTLLSTFGIAMAPVGAMILIGLGVAYRHPGSLWFNANRWLAYVAFGALIFGAMAFFQSDRGILAKSTFGGDLGLSIIGAPDNIGILVLVGIGIGTIALASPRYFLKAGVTAVTLVAIGLAITATGLALLGRAVTLPFGSLKAWHERRRVQRWIGSLSSGQANSGMGYGTMLQQRAEQAHEADTEALRFPMGVTNTLEPYKLSTMPVTNIEEEAPSVEEVGQELREVSLEPALNTPVNGTEKTDSDGEIEQELREISPELVLNATVDGEEKTVSDSELPPIDLLDSIEAVELQPADNEQRAEMIKEALASHGIEVNVAQINPGPTVTQFGVEPGWFRKYKEIKERTEEGKIKVDSDGNPVVHLEEVSKKRVKVDQVAALDKDLALALAAPSIRIEAPVPGKALVGIEVPNAAMGVVGLKEAIGSPQFQKMLGKSNLALALGKGSAGEVVADTLARMPHLLIAGATGSGKSVAITSLISCLLMHNTPEELRFVLIDPKRVELLAFSTIPHLITPVIVDMEKVVDTLKWVSKEMDRRYKLMASAAARNIDSYNKKVTSTDKMPFLVVVIDELADLMSVSPFDVEQALTRLAQMGRATGIHLVVATQRPSVDVITGLIKANFPTRLSFAVTSMMDSRVILDTGGAEKLLGRGDMLYLPSDASKPRRLQGVYLSDQEVDRLVYHWTEQRGQLELPLVADEFTDGSKAPKEVRDEDPMVTKARDLAMGLKSISTSLLQRRLGIGYPRAAKLIDLLEEEGIVSSGEPGKSRKVIKDPQPADDYFDD